MKKHFLFALVGTLFYSASGLSCSFHEAGASNIAKFPPVSPPLHPVMLQHFSPPDVAPIKLSLYQEPNQTSRNRTLTINYELHPDYKDVKAEVVSTGGVKIDGRTTMYLTRLKGNKTIKYSAEDKKKQNIRVRISAVRRDKPIIVEKNVYISQI